jgi:hypothetical protein
MKLTIKKYTLAKVVSIALVLSIAGCKQVQNSKDDGNGNGSGTSTPIDSAGILQIINNYMLGQGVTVSAGASDAGKLVKLDANGKIDASMLSSANNPLVNLSTAGTFAPIESLPNVLFTRVNRADEVQVPDVGLKVSRFAGANSSGSFYGTGLGNKAFLGVATEGMKLSDLTSLKVRGQNVTGNSVNANLLLDIDGNITTQDDRVVVTAQDVGAEFNSSSMTTVTVAPSDPEWLVSVDAGLPLVSLGLNLLNLGGSQSLDTLKTLNPNAKIVNGLVFDAEYPKGLPVPGIHLSFGSAANILPQSTIIESIEVNGAVYDFK